MKEHIEMISPQIIGKIVYELECLVLAFEYFLISDLSITYFEILNRRA